MRPPAAPPGALALLGRLDPGDHGLLFGPSELSAVVLETLVARADELGFQLVLAHPGLVGPALAGVAARALGPNHAALAGLSLWGAEAFGILRRAVVQGGPSALQALEAAAQEIGFSGALVAIVHADALDPEAVAMEAALAARLGPRLAVQCLYPSPPSARDQALRLLRAHTPGRMVMPSVWRLAEQAAPARAAAAADEGRPPVLA
jgi:hypothetical protein